MERYADNKISEKTIPVFFLLKCLLFSYILTAVLLLLLTLLMYQLGLSEQMVSLAIIVIYVIATFFAGFVTGKKMQNRKFLWGFAIGAVYFLVLLIVSLLVNQSPGNGNSFTTTLVLCTAGGMLGGMLS